MSSAYSFTNISGTITKSFALNGIPFDQVYVPTSRNANAVYTYGLGTGTKRQIIAIPGNQPTPPGSILLLVAGDAPVAPSPVIPPPPPAKAQVATPPSIPSAPAPVVSVSSASVLSKGDYYISTSGETILIPPGLPVPSGWTKQLVPDPSLPQVAGSNNISSGEVFQNPSNGAYIDVPPGNVVPNLWIRVPESQIPSSAEIIKAPDVAASQAITQYVAQQAAMQAQVASDLKAIVPIIGVVGFAYLAYLIIMKPNAAKQFVERMTIAKDIVVDGAWIAVAGGILAAGGFVTYEFASYYNHYGSVGKALEYMTEDTITNVLEVIVDVLIGAAKAIIDYFEKSGFSPIGSTVSVIKDISSGMSVKDSITDSFSTFTGGLPDGSGTGTDGWTK